MFQQITKVALFVSQPEHWRHYKGVKYRKAPAEPGRGVVIPPCKFRLFYT